ncbi:rhodanese-related sulfurtransferase [Jannaschia aquimarina]|uniref:tRNA uridine(34) hydroxylase n=1 Tax=Jannaschia aquimarina TaxID=935700 RepID=A0A0D1EQV5_9RHOB|nr:rhodanese domain-containing protein [Jannaschia aquimarina]KIT18025.1 putative rhodanese-related sulfurtransferase [Jannaschia aquimarina]SNS88783.1 UPF0176 protein [Jannaschia aquimarina]
MDWTVAGFYRFTPLDPVAARAALAGPFCRLGIKGSVLLAEEGVNGTIAGTDDAVAEAVGLLRALPGCADLAPRLSRADAPPFGRLKVRLKREIVSMGRPGPLGPTARRVAPGDWDALIAADDVAVIDVRNGYESAIGTFDGALVPGTETFRDFPAWWEANRAALAGKRLATFCTGGIRCEKAGAFLAEQGVDVAQLDGGILAYLAQRPDGGAWRGGCFVYDERVALGPGLAGTDHVLCRACRRPVEAADTRRPDWEDGVSCHLCIGEFSEEDRARFRERTRQMALAERRGEAHLGRTG